MSELPGRSASDVVCRSASRWVGESRRRAGPPVTTAHDLASAPVANRQGTALRWHRQIGGIMKIEAVQPVWGTRLNRCQSAAVPVRLPAPHCEALQLQTGSVALSRKRLPLTPTLSPPCEKHGGERAKPRRVRESEGKAQIALSPRLLQARGEGRGEGQPLARQSISGRGHVPLSKAWTICDRRGLATDPGSSLKGELSP